MLERVLDRMFNADSIAVIGASNDSQKKGYEILKNIINAGYSGNIFPINLKQKEILGLKAYPGVLDIKEDIDLAVVVIPSKFVPKTMKEIGQKGIKNVIIITGGFREIGNDQIEKEMMDIVKQYGISVVGPNCQGVNYTPNNLCASWPLITKKGPLAIIAQSGTVAATFGMWAEQECLGISSLVSLGNKSGLNEIDFIKFFAKDDNTKVISLNLEGINNGNTFMNLVKKVTDKKPVVILKPGRTQRGRKAAQSHTKSISGSDVIFDGACKQIDAVRANSLTELYDYSKALALLDKPKGNKVMIITSSGGSGILATDIFEENNIEVTELNTELINELKRDLPSHCVISNPLDLTGDTDAYRYEKCIEIANRYKGIDMYLLIFGDPIPNACNVVKNLKEKVDKPLIVCYLGGGATEREELILMHQSGIPVFPTPERAAKAASILLRKKQKGVL